MPDVGWYTEEHTNSLVPFYAKGPGSNLFIQQATGVDKVYGKFIDNTDIGKILSDLLLK